MEKVDRFVTFRLENSVYEKLKKESVKNCRPVSGELRNIVQLYLNANSDHGALCK